MNLSPLAPLQIRFFDGNVVTLPAVSVKQISNAENIEEWKDAAIKYITGVGTSSAARQLLVKSTPIFIQIIASLDLGKSIIDQAMLDETLIKELKDNDYDWFVENWQYISTGIDVSTLSSELIFKFATKGDNIVTIFRKNGNTEAADEIENIVEDAKKITKSGDDLLDNSGKFIDDELVKQGKKGVTEVLDSKYKSIDEFLTSTEYSSKVTSDFAKYQAKGGKLDLTKYTNKHKVITKNRMQGKIAEDVFMNLEKGFKPNTGIQTSDGIRYVDNILDGTARELKSGRITLNSSFQRQVNKDLEIIQQQLSLDVQKIEWHALDGIDDNALEFIRKQMEIFEISSDLFKVVIY